MPRGSRKASLIVVLAVAGAVAVYLYAAPYLAFRDLKQAAFEGNTEALRELVDFPSLRSSIKDELSGQISKYAVDKMSNRNSGMAILGSAIASPIINVLVDHLVTPQLIVSMVNGRKLDGAPDSLAGLIDHFGASPDRSENEPNISTGYESFDRFCVRIPLPRSKEAVTLVLLRSGLATWRLSGIRLPALDSLTSENDETSTVVASPASTTSIETASASEANSAVQAQTAANVEPADPSQPPVEKSATGIGDLPSPPITAPTPQIQADSYADPMSQFMSQLKEKSVLPAATPDASGGTYRAGGEVSSPILISKVEPEYSEEARTAKHSGTVLLSVVVDEDGVPTEIHVVRPLGLGLDEKAIEAAQKWRFRPGVKSGRPVRVRATIELCFRLL